MLTLSRSSLPFNNHTFLFLFLPIFSCPLPSNLFLLHPLSFLLLLRFPQRCISQLLEVVKLVGILLRRCTLMVLLLVAAVRRGRLDVGRVRKERGGLLEWWLGVRNIRGSGIGKWTVIMYWMRSYSNSFLFLTFTFQFLFSFMLLAISLFHLRWANLLVLAINLRLKF